MAAAVWVAVAGRGDGGGGVGGGGDGEADGGGGVGGGGDGGPMAAAAWVAARATPTRWHRISARRRVGAAEAPHA